MRHTLKNRLARSSSRLMLAVVAATASLAAGAASAAAQETPPTKSTATKTNPDQPDPGQAAPNQIPPQPTNATGDTAVPPANPVGAATPTTPDAAQTVRAIDSAQIGDIVVTARLKAENIQTVPQTIVAITPEVLKNNQINNYYELMGFAPSVAVSTGWNKEYTGVLIRGFGTSTFFSEIPGLPSSLYDMSNVQILYGPQGTLFGYTALGGAILYTPSHPEMNRWGAGLDVTVGNLNTNNVQGYINIPLAKDQLALRIAGARNHTDGYIRVQGRSDRLDGVDNESLRIGLEYKSPGGKFTNYLLGQLNYQHNTATPEAVSFFNPLGGYSSLTGTTATGVPLPGPNFVGGGGQPAYFAYACSPATLAQVWAPGTTAAQCQAQHVAVLATFQQQALAAVQLTRSSRGYEIPGPIENVPLRNPIHTNLLINITNWDALKWEGALGGGSLSFHNVADITFYNNLVTNFTVGAFDYYSTGTKVIFPTPRPSLLQPGSVSPPTDGFGAPRQPAFNRIYHDEFQIHGTLADNLGRSPGLTYVIGFYNSIAPRGPYNGNPTSQNIPISFNGAYALNEGPAPSYLFPADGTKSTFFGQYVNLIADLGALYKPLTGIQLTGGIRFNQNTTRFRYYNYSTDYTSPNVFTRTTPVTSDAVNRTFKSKPTNYSGALTYLTSNNTAYVNFSHILVPGFANTALLPGVTLNQVPGYTPDVKPQVLNDYELGDKWRFRFGNVHGYINLALYYMRFKDVQIAQTVFIPSLNGGTYVAYTGNPADQVRKGVEFQGEIFPTDRLDLYANFSFSKNYYTRYLAVDPTSLFTATAGYTPSYSSAPGAVNSPYCVPSASQATIPAGATAGSCIFDFSDTPVPFAPKFQASVRASYTLPLERDLGDLVFNVTANYIAKQFFQGGYSNIPLVREKQLLGPAVEDAVSSPAHTLVNLRLQWNKPFGQESFTAAAYMTNVFDTRYASSSLDFLFATGVATQDFGPPRQFGLQFSARF